MSSMMNHRRRSHKSNRKMGAYARQTAQHRIQTQEPRSSLSSLGILHFFQRRLQKSRDRIRDNGGAE